MKKRPIFAAILVIALCQCTPLRTHAQVAASSGDKAAIEALEQSFLDAFNAKDVKAIMACYAPGKSLFVFDVTPPREHLGWDDYKRDWEGFFAAFSGPVSVRMSELNVTVVGPVAYGRNIESGTFTSKDGSKTAIVVRVTDVYRKIDNKWLIVQEHVSVPVDLATGKADMMSKP
jgi:ketosteroid isomerase-like protein